MAREEAHIFEFEVSAWAGNVQSVGLIGFMDGDQKDGMEENVGVTEQLEMSLCRHLICQVLQTSAFKALKYNSLMLQSIQWCQMKQKNK